MSRNRFLHANVVYFQGLSNCLVKGDFGVRVIGHRLYFRALVGGEILLGLNHQADVGNAEAELILLGFQALFGKLPGRNGSFIAGTSLLQSDHGHLHVGTHLVGRALKL